MTELTERLSTALADRYERLFGWQRRRACLAHAGASPVNAWRKVGIAYSTSALTATTSE